MKRTIELVVATLREVFDESAYERFLRRTQLQTSADSYAEFRKEQEVLKARSAKCC